MPLGMWEADGATLNTLSMMCIAVLMLSCDELATQLEHP